jgi:Fic family protein
MAHEFHGRRLPEQAEPAGYAWLIEKYDLRVPLPPRLAGIAAVHHKVETPEWLLLTPRHAPEETLAGHLAFALKWEGLNLSALAALARVVSPNTLAEIIRGAPNGRYTRRLWFTVEWLTGTTLDVPDADKKRAVVLVLDPDQQIALHGGELSERHRVRNTLPGTADFCPLVRITPELVRVRARALDERARSVVGRTRQDVIARAAAFLQLSDSKASFALEKETAGADRAHRWAHAIARAGTENLSIETLEALQREVIGDHRFVPLGLRAEGGFIGEHDRDTGRPIPEHISARADDLRSLMRGLVAYQERALRYGMDAVAAAASMAFGFVYIHPFVDGNGRLHRWLIHHVLAALRYAPPNIVFPVSATMLRELNLYKKVLESYSQPLLECIDWRPTESGNVEVLNATRDHYGFFDATAHTEFLYHCIEETVDHDWPAEVAYLEAFDRFAAGLQEIVDMPQATVNLLHRFLRQNSGRLSQRARSKEFEALTDQEVEAIETVYATTTGALPDERGSDTTADHQTTPSG